ncbi:MAG: DinB family protein [Actinomycetota bacterium]|nr:DinB family protein [Actinomycetota bacterium]
MGITPDTKDWTWVLERPCPQCGFDLRRFPRSTYASAIRENAARWPSLLAEEGVGHRLRPDRWSTLEYACHVRDVFRVFVGRLDMTRRIDAPTFDNWDQDATAVAERYGDQNPAEVAGELVHAAEELAREFDSVNQEEWSRAGYRSNGSHFTLESLGGYLIHDPIHHLYDVAGIKSG